jgi:hypothetical protein
MNPIEWYKKTKGGDILFYICLFYLFTQFVEAYFDGNTVEFSMFIGIVFVGSFVFFAIIDLIKYLFNRVTKSKTNVVNITTTGVNDSVTVVSKNENTKVIINGEELK